MIRFLLTSIAVTFLAAGCAALERTEPVFNVNGMPVTTGSMEPITQNDVGEAIATGAINKGWQVEKTGPGHIVATIHLRSHMAKTDITYTADEYSIAYKDSNNLLHEGTVIHRNYNRWVKYLSRSINEELRRH